MFSGHTQVNATDLRNMKYPDFKYFQKWSWQVADKIKEALQILIDLRLPKVQQNERTALCLLALTDIKKDTKWADAQNPLIGITPIMEFAK